MLYTGGRGVNLPWGIGYATSSDGVVWTRYGDAPVMAFEADQPIIFPNSVIIVDGIYYLYHTMNDATGVYPEIGVSIGAITRE